MNYSKLAITTLILSSAFVACSEEITENTVDTKYTANASKIKTAGQAVDLGLTSGTKWADMNVGASSASDNGILFIWGDITGTQMMANTATTYTDVTEATSLSKLFDLFSSGTFDDGVLCDTAKIVQASQPKLIETSEMTDREIKEAILAFLKAKLDEAKKSYTGEGLLEAALVNEEFKVIMNWNGTEYTERIPSLEALYDIHPEWGQQVTPEDSLKYYSSYQYDEVSSLTIDEIFTTKVTYNTCWLANNSSAVKDILGTEIRKDYTGGEIGNAPKDRFDDKKKDNLAFVPVYSIISDANHDPATANWGGNWRMPTTMEIIELINECEWEFTGSGYKVTGSNGNSIFLPAAGYRFGDKLYGNGNAGYYATGEITGTYNFPSMAAQSKGDKGSVSSHENMPNVMVFQHGQFVNSVDIYSNLSSSFGVSIRPVTK